MKITVDIDGILTPIPGDNPAGENLRYTQTWEAIEEARKADDQLAKGDWKAKGELKTSDWFKVIDLSIDALTNKSKDLQIAVWLLEALLQKEGYDGLLVGLKIIKESAAAAYGTMTVTAAIKATDGK